MLLAGMRRLPMKIRQEDASLLIQGLPFHIAQPVQSHAQMPEHLRVGCRGHTGRRDRAPRAEPDLACAGWFVPRMVRPVYRRQAAIKIVREMPATGPTEWSAPMTSSMIDQLDDGFVQDPHAAFERLRAERPVTRAALPGGWLVTRYADARAALADSRLTKDWRTLCPAADAGPDAGVPRRWTPTCSAPTPRTTIGSGTCWPALCDR